MATISKKQGSHLGLAFGFAAISSAVIVAVAPMLFDAPSYAAFMVFWGVMFTFSGVLTGFNLEATRAISAASVAEGAESANVATGAGGTETIGSELNATAGPRVVWVAAALTLILSVLVAATAVWWGPVQFPAYALPLAFVVAFGVAGCGIYMAVGGALAGSGRWSFYAGQISVYAGLQLVLVVLITLFTHSVVAAAFAVTLSFLVGVALLTVSPAARAAAAIRTNAPLRTLLLQFGAAALASGASAVLVIGFPALIALTTSREIIETAGPLFLALTLTRAPLMIPLNAVQGVVVSHFAKQRAQGLKALLPIILIALIVGGVAIAGAWALGPWLLKVIWGPAFIVNGPTLGALTAGATTLAVITLTGAVCQSLTLHKAFVLGWVVSVVLAVALLFLPLPLMVRAPLALAVGPLAGIVIHLVALQRAR